MPVNVPDSRPSSSLGTLKVMSVSASKHPRKSRLLSVLPSSLPSSASFLCVVDIGAQISVLHTVCQRRKAESVVASLSEYVRLERGDSIGLPQWYSADQLSSLFQLQEVLASSLHQPSNACCSLLVSKMRTLPLLDQPRLWRIPLRLRSLQSATPTVS